MNYSWIGLSPNEAFKVGYVITTWRKTALPFADDIILEKYVLHKLRNQLAFCCYSCASPCFWQGWIKCGSGEHRSQKMTRKIEEIVTPGYEEKRRGRKKKEKKKKRKLDDSRTSMPALARPCTSGVETSKPMQVTCWHCGCWDHYECVDNQYLSPYRTGGKWLPWFLRKSRPFIFKYRPLGPTYFNIWGIFTIVGIFLIKW